MKASGRALALDLSLAVIGMVLTAVAVWSVNVIATPFAGPTWLKVIWPLLIGAPLALRRGAPLLGWTIIWAGISLQALITGNSPEGLELMFVLAVGSYSSRTGQSARQGTATRPGRQTTSEAGRRATMAQRSEASAQGLGVLHSETVIAASIRNS